MRTHIALSVHSLVSVSSFILCNLPVPLQLRSNLSLGVKRFADNCLNILLVVHAISRIFVKEDFVSGDFYIFEAQLVDPISTAKFIVQTDCENFVCISKWKAVSHKPY